MRLIDAENLDEKAVEFPNTSIWVPIEAVWDEPTIDAVPVVRCKDCKNGKTWKSAFGIEGFKCDLLCVDLSPEAFCYYGVRKDGGE